MNALAEAGLEEAAAAIDKAVADAVRELNHPALNAVPIQLLEIFACKACTVAVFTVLAQQFDLMRQAEQAQKQ